MKKAITLRKNRKTKILGVCLFTPLLMAGGACYLCEAEPLSYKDIINNSDADTQKKIVESLKKILEERQEEYKQVQQKVVESKKELEKAEQEVEKRKDEIETAKKELNLCQIEIEQYNKIGEKLKKAVTKLNDVQKKLGNNVVVQNKVEEELEKTKAELKKVGNKQQLIAEDNNQIQQNGQNEQYENNDNVKLTITKLTPDNNRGIMTVTVKSEDSKNLVRAITTFPDDSIYSSKVRFDQNNNEASFNIPVINQATFVVYASNHSNSNGVRAPKTSAIHQAISGNISLLPDNEKITLETGKGKISESLKAVALYAFLYPIERFEKLLITGKAVKELTVPDGEGTTINVKTDGKYTALNAGALSENDIISACYLDEDVFKTGLENIPKEEGATHVDSYISFGNNIKAKAISDENVEISPYNMGKLGYYNEGERDNLDRVFKIGDDQSDSKRYVINSGVDVNILQKDTYIKPGASYKGKKLDGTYPDVSSEMLFNQYKSEYTVNNLPPIKVEGDNLIFFGVKSISYPDIELGSPIDFDNIPTITIDADEGNMISTKLPYGKHYDVTYVNGDKQDIYIMPYNTGYNSVYTVENGSWYGKILCTTEKPIKYITWELNPDGSVDCKAYLNENNVPENSKIFLKTEGKDLVEFTTGKSGEAKGNCDKEITQQLLTIMNSGKSITYAINDESGGIKYEGKINVDFQNNTITVDDQGIKFTYKKLDTGEYRTYFNDFAELDEAREDENGNILVDLMLNKDTITSITDSTGKELEIMTGWIGNLKGLNAVAFLTIPKCETSQTFTLQSKFGRDYNEEINIKVEGEYVILDLGEYYQKQSIRIEQN